MRHGLVHKIICFLISHTATEVETIASLIFINSLLHVQKTFSLFLAATHQRLLLLLLLLGDCAAVCSYMNIVTLPTFWLVS